MNMLGPGNSMNYDDWYRQWFQGSPGGQSQTAPKPEQATPYENPFQAAMPEMPKPGQSGAQAFAPPPQNVMAQGGAQSIFDQAGLDPKRQEMAMMVRQRLGMG